MGIYSQSCHFFFLDLLGDSPHEIARRAMNGSAGCFISTAVHEDAALAVSEWVHGCLVMTGWEFILSPVIFSF